MDPLWSRLEFAIEASLRAGDLVLSYWRTEGLRVELKGDETPVTAADRGAEQQLRTEIRGAFPEDGVLGEEFGETPGTSGWRWILDPVDGTKSFVAGVPLFGTLIGIEENGASAAGVCRFPALGETLYAALGRGAFWRLDGQAARRARVSETSELREALFCFTSAGGWDAVGQMDRFVAMCRAVRLTRGWGDCYGHALVATGRADIAIDPQMNLWDAAALVPILLEAGGVFCDWSGRVTAAGGRGVSTTPALKDSVLQLLNDRLADSAARGRD